MDEAEAQDAAKPAEPADEDEDEAAEQDAQADNASEEVETAADTNPQDEPAHEDSLKETVADDDALEDDAPVEAAAEEPAAKEAASNETAPKESAPDFAFASGRLRALTARAAEFETAVASREDHWDPDGTTDDDNNATQLVATLPWLDHSPDEDGSADDTSTDDSSADDTSAETPHSANDTEGLDPFVPEEDDADEANFYAEDDPAPTPKAPGNAFMAEDDLLEEGADTFLDEDALRDLVSEIVRQELQGSLGERITRNVRKLVRREIQRALAAQELE